ncbi:MAG: Hsp20/alpha crystallin family protein [Gammaproteobacteria bacterium]|nr:Hsp20/alpha crystallin family protein [Gammaproteobacteria bacterium]
MSMREIKDNATSFWQSLSSGWQRLVQSGSDALTHFRGGDQAGVPKSSQVDNEGYWPAESWSVIGGDVFEDDQQVIVRLEVPGMRKDDLAIELLDNHLIVSGEKRFQEESTQGRWRVVQCAYGSFRRVVPLPAVVKTEQAAAHYRDGVLRVELPKASPGKQVPRRISVS